MFLVVSFSTNKINKYIWHSIFFALLLGQKKENDFIWIFKPRKKKNWNFLKLKKEEINYDFYYVGGKIFWSAQFLYLVIYGHIKL